MNAKSLLPLLTTLLIAPAAVPLLPTAPVRAQTTTETDAATLVEESIRLYGQGLQQFDTSQFREAIASWEQALEIARVLDNRQAEGAVLYMLGNAYGNLAQYEQAIELYQEALSIARETGNRQHEGNTLNNLGLAYNSLGQYQEAIAFHEQSLAIAREIGDRQGEGGALNSLGNAYRNLGRYQEAIDLYKRVLVIAREIGYRQGEGITLGDLGAVYVYLGQYQEAIVLIEQSLAIARETGNRQGEGDALNNLGVTYRDLGQYQEAIDLHEQRLVLAREIGDRQGEDESLNNLGIAYADLGQYQRAIDLYEESLVIAREIGDQQGETSALGNLGIAYADLGQYQEAIALYEQSLVIFREIGDQQGEGSALNTLGNAYRNLGQYQEAIDLHEQSLAIAREIGNRQGAGYALNNLGLTYADLGQYQEAIDLYEQSLAIAREIDDQRGEGIALNNLGLAYRNLGQYQTAIDFHEQSLAIYRGIGYRSGESSALGNLGLAYAALGQYPIDLYEQQLLIAREIGNRRSEGIALNNLGNVYLQVERYQEAINFYQQGNIIFREIGDRRSEGESLSNLGLVYSSLEQYSQATELLLSSIDVLESLRNEDIPDAQQITFFDTQSSPYLFLQRSLIAQGETEQALAISERGRARAFVSSLAERQNLDAPALPPPSIADIQRTAQAQNATLVQYSRASFENGVSQLYIWVIQPTGEITFRSVDLSGLDTSLSDFITTGRDAIGLRSRTATIAVVSNPEAQQAQAEQQRQILQDLHTLLIDPIADLLPTDPDAPVIIIPHQELFLVPFAALVDANGDYLIQNHTLLTAPSIQVLQLLGEQQATTATGDPLIIGNPIMPSIWNPATGEDENLSSLPGAEAEAVAIATALNTEPLLWEQASETAVTRRMATAPILHFATHGLLDYGDPTATGVRDFPGAIALAAGEGNDGLLTSAEIFDLTLSAELVVLSACDTGRGRITGDGVIGLSRAFIQAGVPQVLVSLWAVPDAPTAELMTTFYQQRDLTDTDAQALRQAMLITLQTHPNPRNWAAFTLIGGAQ